mgnify:CR=1 FL=1
MIGQRLTKQKELILQIMKTTDTHLTADEIWRLAKDELSGIGLATIYRNLELMVDGGLIEEIYIAGWPKWYELKKSGYHGHAFCEQCGRLQEVVNCSLCLVKNRLQQEEKFEGREWRFLVIGRCKKCQPKN